MKPLVLFHGDGCTDGFGAAWSFWTKYKDTYEYISVEYGDVPPDVTGRDVYLVDFSYKREVVVEMLKVANKVYFIDHHKTAIDDLAGLSKEHKNFFDFSNVKKSGAYLAWQFVHGNVLPAPTIIHHIQDRDLWKFVMPNTKEITAFLHSVPFDFNAWDNYVYSYAYHDSMLIAGKTLLAMQAKNIQSILDKGVFEVEIQGHVVPCVNCPKFMASDIGEKLYKDKPFSVTYFDTPGKREFSLRSDKNNPNSLDVGIIALHQGGGGHKHAAGFKLDIPLTDVHMTQKINPK